MPRAVPMITDFTGGLLSPRAEARVDLETYQKTCRQLKNFMVVPHGPVTKRPGFEYINSAATSGGSVSLRPFVFSQDDSYVMEFGPAYIRFFVSGGRLESAGGTPIEVVTPYASGHVHQLALCQSGDVVYIAHPEYAPRKLSRLSHTSWTLATVDFTAPVAIPGTPTATLSGAGAARYHRYKITSLTEDLYESTPTAAGATQGPWNLDSSNQVTVTWAKAGDAYESRVYKELYGSGVYGFIGTASGGTLIDDGLEPDPDDTPPVGNTPFTGASNYPTAVTFFERRLCWAGTYNEPTTVWMSKTGDYENMDRAIPAKDDDSLEFGLASDRVDSIRWIQADKSMLIGTAGDEWSLGGAGGDPITPSSVQANRATQYGSAWIGPVTVGGAALFVDRYGRTVRQFQYSLTDDRYHAPDLSILAEHLTATNGIQSWAYQQAPDSIIWAVRDDGALLSLTYEPEHKVVGWAEHDTWGDFESVAVIPGDDRDELWASVKRNIGGTVYRYIERMDAKFEVDILNGEPRTLDAFFVDSGLKYDNPLAIATYATGATIQVTTSATHGFSDGDRVRIFGAYSGSTGATPSELNGNRYYVANSGTLTFDLVDSAGDAISGTGFRAYYGEGVVRKSYQTFGGYDHLAGMDVDVLADGGVLTGLTVTSGGTVDLTTLSPERWAHTLAVGLGYTSKVEPQILNAGAADGVALGRIKRISEITLRVHETLGLELSADDEAWVEVPPEAEQLVPGYPPTPESGEKTLSFYGIYDTEARIIVRSDQPVPATIMGLIPRVRTDGR